MTALDRKTELQRRIAVARGWTDLVVHTTGMTGILYADEGRVSVPRWSWDMADAWPLVDAMMERHPGALWAADGSIFRGPEAYFGLRVPGESHYMGEGDYLPEAIAECWLAARGVDVGDLPRRP